MTSTGCWRTGRARRGRLVQRPRIRCRRLSGRGEIRDFKAEFLALWDEVRFEMIDGPVEVRGRASWSRGTSPTFEDETALKFRLEARG